VDTGRAVSGVILSLELLRDTDHRRFNQAWFARSYIDAVPDDPTTHQTATARVLCSPAAFQTSRQPAPAEFTLSEEARTPGSIEPGGDVPLAGLIMTKLE
jgi:hypothetical protein